MTEKQLTSLNFEKQVQPEEWYSEDEYEPGFHYYTLDIEDISFISSASDQSGKSKWWVELGEGNFRFTKINKLKKFIDILQETILTKKD